MKTRPIGRQITSTSKTTIEWIPLGRLIVDPDLQRQYDENRARRMADSLDLDALGLLRVSSRPQGYFHIEDGQHRRGALLLAGFTDTDLVQCIVDHGLSREDEAKRFVGMNTFAAPRAFDKFKVRIKGGDPIALGIDRILMEHGWRVASGAIQGAFTAVVAAERVYTGYGTSDKERGPENFRQALGVLTEAWGTDPNSAHGALIQGLGLFFAKYGPDVDKGALVRRLAQYPGGANNYIGKARGIREFRSGTLPRCVAELTVEIYNRRRSTGQLPAWHDA